MPLHETGPWSVHVSSARDSNRTVYNPVPRDNQFSRSHHLSPKGSLIRRGFVSIQMQADYPTGAYFTNVFPRAIQTRWPLFGCDPNNNKDFAHATTHSCHHMHVMTTVCRSMCKNVALHTQHQITHTSCEWTLIETGPRPCPAKWGERRSDELTHTNWLAYRRTEMTGRVAKTSN